jgi:ADP-ribose pyrophosphatase
MARIKLELRVSSKRIYDGHIVNLRVDEVKLENGKTAKREIVEHRGATAIVPILEDGRVVLVRQYRYAAATELLEIPAGTLEPDEAPENCARRELEEETGFKCREIKKMMEIFLAPGYSTEKIHIYLATGLSEAKMRLEEDERINVEKVPISTALEMVSSGKIQDAKTISGLYVAARFL